MKTKCSNVFKQFRWVLSKLPHVDKESIVYSWSECQTTSSKEFYANNPEGFAGMVKYLMGLAKCGDYVSNAGEVERLKGDAEVKRLRSAILVRLQNHGVNTADWNAVNGFLANPRIAGKMLWQMSIAEMTTLIKKLESILKKDSEEWLRREFERVRMREMIEQQAINKHLN